jgi:hypothetical protein
MNNVASNVLAHAGRIAWDEELLIAVLTIPLLAGICYLVAKALRSNR